MKLSLQHYKLLFINPSGTSRGILRTKESLILTAHFKSFVRLGEISFIPGLNVRTQNDTISKVQQIVNNLNNNIDFTTLKTPDYPEIQFALDMINQPPLPNAFNRGRKGIPINGLIWMGKIEFMQNQIEQKLRAGYKVIKIKIGAIDWDEELDLLKKLRTRFPAEALEIRVDANGAFTESNINAVLDALSDLKVHSIEQPIKAGNWLLLKKLCNTSPVPIALDEELIGIYTTENKKDLLEYIRPQYLILKPGLMGGFTSCDEWISLATERGIGYWVTSALESNLGLNAIAQWTFEKHPHIPQGLGTGSLFSNNIPSPLEIRGQELYYNPKNPWNYSILKRLPLIDLP